VVQEKKLHTELLKKKRKKPARRQGKTHQRTPLPVRKPMEHKRKSSE